VLIDLIGSVASQRAVNVQYVDNGRSKLDAFLETTLLIERCRQKLKAGAARLRVAAGQLRQQVEQGNVFVHELSRLQACYHSYVLYGAIASFRSLAVLPSRVLSGLCTDTAVPSSLAFVHDCEQLSAGGPSSVGVLPRPDEIVCSGGCVLLVCRLSGACNHPPRSQHQRSTHCSPFRSLLPQTVSSPVGAWRLHCHHLSTFASHLTSQAQS
jgi:hypothetical protein